MNVIQQLQLFSETVDELRNTNVMKKGLSSDMTIKSSKVGENWDVRFVTPKWPEEDDLRSFLLTFRMFISEKEPVFLNRIFNLSIKTLTDDRLKSFMIDAKEKWKKAEGEAVLSLKYQGKLLTLDQIASLWISGKYFHKDPDKRQILQDLDYHTEMIFKHQFLDFLVIATNYIFYADRIVKHAIKEGLIKE